jgi:hypothetical protein
MQCVIEKASARWQSDRMCFDNDSDGAHLIGTVIKTVIFSKSASFMQIVNSV